MFNVKIVIAQEIYIQQEFQKYRDFFQVHWKLHRNQKFQIPSEQTQALYCAAFLFFQASCGVCLYHTGERTSQEKNFALTA